MGLPNWSLDGARRGPGPIGPLYIVSALFSSMGTLFGDLSEGLRAVNGIRSSLTRSSFFSNEAKAGSLSLAVPFAPLTMGMVGCAVLGTGSLFCRL